MFVCAISVRSQPVFSGESSAKVILYFVSPKLFFRFLKTLFPPCQPSQTCPERRSNSSETVPLNRGANVSGFAFVPPLPNKKMIILTHYLYLILYITIFQHNRYVN